MTDTGARILYIDDDEGLRLLTRRALERKGFVVTTVANGTDGVALAASEPFDLVAVDHFMPGIDGLETLARLQALEMPPPVIYVTGSDETRLAVAALKAGAIDYVVKTVNEDFFDLLEQAIGQALAAVRLRAAKEAAERQLRETNARLQAMLQEVNHRVANSLQLVSSFVHLQSRGLDDTAAKTALADTQRRIAAIAQVHKHLYTSDNIAEVNMADYLESLLSELSGTWSTPAAPRSILLSSDPIWVPTDRAVSLGIIVTELVTNACKYAYAANEAGEIRVAVADTGARELTLVVEDRGCGMKAAGPVQGTGIGGRLIQAMSASLKADLRYDEIVDGVKAVLTVAI